MIGRPVAELPALARQADIHDLELADDFGESGQCFQSEQHGLMFWAAKGKVVLLPHMGSATIEGRIDMGEKVIINIRAFFDGHRPPDRVLPLRA